MAKQTTLKEGTAVPILKKRKKKKAKRPPALGSSPLPPPVAVPSVAAAPQSDSYGLNRLFSNQPPRIVEVSAPESESFSNSDEPEPGEPLSEEAQHLLDQVPELAGEAMAPGPRAVPMSAEPDHGAAQFSELMSGIDFNESDVRDVLEEIFEWTADKFDSEHWLLTERQSKMLGRPTAQLLTSVWSKLSMFLPDILARWCDSTPGLSAFILTGAIVLGPKIGKQVAVSRARRTHTLPGKPGKASPASPRPQWQPGPVGVADTSPVQPIAGD